MGITGFRDPDDLIITITRHPHRGETSLTLVGESEGLRVAIYDGWAPVPDAELAFVVGRAVELWLKLGPLAAASFASHVEEARRRSRRRR